MNEDRNFPNPNGSMTIPAEQPPSETRQEYRMAEIPELYRKTHERLAVELALKVDTPDAVFAEYGYTPEQAVDLLETPAFEALLRQAAKEVQTTGLSFKMKTQIMAGELLPYAHDIATDPMQSAAVRADIIQWTARMAGFEPKKVEETKTGGGLTLTIQFAGNQPEKIVSTEEPLTIENGE